NGARGGRSVPAVGRTCVRPLSGWRRARGLWLCPDRYGRVALCGRRHQHSADLPTTALVVDGIYGRTRNPLYLGGTLVYLGLSVAAGSLWSIVLMVPLLWVINVGVIAREERYLERKFGDVYRAYKRRVRRWV